MNKNKVLFFDSKNDSFSSVQFFYDDYLIKKNFLFGNNRLCVEEQRIISQLNFRWSGFVHSQMYFKYSEFREDEFDLRKGVISPAR
jgi:hypothetical protein